MTSEVAKLDIEPHVQVSGAASRSGWVSSAISQASRLQESSSLPLEVRERVAQARDVWSKVLFPTPRLEAWKYTNTDAIAKGPFSVVTANSNDAEVVELLGSGVVRGFETSCVVVFVDGVYSSKHSIMAEESGVEVTRLLEGSEAARTIGDLGQHSEDPFAALATALVSDSVCVSVDRGYTAKTPIQVVHIATSGLRGAVVTPRVRINAAENARVTVVESHVGAKGIQYLSLPMVELSAGLGAVIDYYKVQAESEAAYHVAGVTAAQAKDSEIRMHLFNFGGALVRNNAQALLRGSGSQALLNGLSLLRQSQHVDNATSIHHIEPHAESREHFKGIYGDSSKGVFSGTITVDKIAQKTNAFQSNQALLLSSDASIESRPQLKIWADDVKCTHGATVGQLDADALFYLRSRGISQHDARAFLVHAFASEVLSSVVVAPLKEHVERMISEKLTALVA